jgi:starch phosphorylase
MAFDFSVLDGGGMKDTVRCRWALTDKRTMITNNIGSVRCSDDIYILENEIILLSMRRTAKDILPNGYSILESMSQIAPDFTMKRMLDDYISRFYEKLATRSSHLAEIIFGKRRKSLLERRSRGALG